MATSSCSVWGLLLGGFTRDVAVRVEHGLPGFFTGVESQFERTGGVLGGQLGTQLDQVNQSLWVCKCQLGNVGMVYLGDHQNVNRLRRVDVVKGNAMLGFGQERRTNLARNNLAKNTIHRVQSYPRITRADWFANDLRALTPLIPVTKTTLQNADGGETGRGSTQDFAAQTNAHGPRTLQRGKLGIGDSALRPNHNGNTCIDARTGR